MNRACLSRTTLKSPGVEAEVWEGRDCGTSIWACAIADDRPDTADVDDVVGEVQRLWQWAPGGQLVLTTEGPCKVSLQVTAERGELQVTAPTAAQCGLPLSAEEERMLGDLDYQPPDDELDAYHVLLDITQKDQLEREVPVLFDTLEHVYGWCPEDGFSWQCEYNSE